AEEHAAQAAWAGPLAATGDLGEHGVGVGGVGNRGTFRRDAEEIAVRTLRQAPWKVHVDAERAGVAVCPILVSLRRVGRARARLGALLCCFDCPMLPSFTG